MRSDGGLVKARPLLSFLIWGTSSLSSTLGVLLKAPLPEGTAALVKAVVASTTSRAYYLIPLFSVVGASAASLRSHADKSRFWKPVRSALAEFQQNVFDEEMRTDVEHAHRVTLYQHKTWALRRKPKRKGLLFAVERSCPLTRGSVATWAAPKDDPQTATGIAGNAYIRAKSNLLVVEDLPDIGAGSTIWTTASRAQRDEALDEYAKRSFCDRAWLEKKRPAARSYIGLRVEVNSDPWGVLVIDSTSPKSKKDSAQAPIQNLAKTLTRLLERVD